MLRTDKDGDSPEKKNKEQIQRGSRVRFYLTTALNSEASKNIYIPEMPRNALIRRLNVYSLAKNKKPLPL